MSNDIDSPDYHDTNITDCNDCYECKRYEQQIEQKDERIRELGELVNAVCYVVQGEYKAIETNDVRGQNWFIYRDRVMKSSCRKDPVNEARVAKELERSRRRHEQSCYITDLDPESGVMSGYRADSERVEKERK